MNADLLLALLKAAALPAAGIGVALIWGGVWLWRHDDVNDCMEQT